MRRLALPLLILVATPLLLPATGAGLSSSTLTRLAPQPDGRANFGFMFRLFDTTDPLWGDTRSFGQRTRDSIQHELGGKTPTFLKVWTPWQRLDQKGKPYVPFSDAAADIAKIRGVVGVQGIVHLDWTIGLSSPANGGLNVSDIRRGRADAYIRSYARDIRDYGKPILLTLFASEFNGDWIWAVSPRANYGLTTPHDLALAWRRVVNIFRAVGATNVSWAWIVNGYSADPREQPQIDRDIGAYYPGDEYVDWVGVDVYDVGTASWMNGPYAFAVAHRKPVFVAEFAIRHEWSSLPSSQWQPWLSSVFDYFESHPAIKAISYFNYCNRAAATHVKWDPSRSVYLDGGQVNYVPDLNDHDHRLLAGGPGLQELFASRIASPRYVSAISTEPVDSTPASASATLLASRAQRRTATVRWTGSLAAHTFDLAIRREAGPWRSVVAQTSATSTRVKGSPGERIRLRVRGRNVDGEIGAWSAPRALVFASA